jgi:hypothetical protein
MHFPRLVSTVTVALAAAACSDSDSSAPDSTTNPNQAAASTGGSTSTSAGGSGGMSAPAASNGGSAAETPATPALNQGGGPASSPGGAAAGAAGTGAMPAAPAVAGDAGGPAGSTMSFFVTSRGAGDGGNFGGLTGADAFCTTLATAANPALAAKTWHAYLSTGTVNARDRIGAGPWRNFAGVVIGNDVAQLHAETPGTVNAATTGAASETTWPLNNVNIALDETGAPVPSGQPAVLHDILTGSNIDGTVSAMGTCSDWTSNTGTTSNGHSNRTGGGTNNSSWNFAHGTGCGQNAAGTNFQMGTVSQGGGRGSIYCFAID